MSLQPGIVTPVFTLDRKPAYQAMADSPILQAAMVALAAEDDGLHGSFELSPPSSDYGTETTSYSSSPPPSPAISSTNITELDIAAIRPPITTPHDLSTPFQSNFFQTLPSPFGGFGCFAAKDLYHGDIILRERPLFVANSANFYDKFGELSHEDRNIFETLCVSGTSSLGTSRVKAIWETNCFSVSPTHSAIFPHASRFNHACHPICSISYTYDPAENCLVMRVRAEHVPKGQELTISYGQAWTPLMLYLRYGFRCECGGCPGVTDREIEELEPEW